jgi:excisionase family DNA binding protein
MPPADTAPAGGGLVVREVAKVLRVSPDRVRAWIKSGELGAINTSRRGKPRFVVLPHHLAAFELARAVAPPPRPDRRRRKRVYRYYPD